MKQNRYSRRFNELAREKLARILLLEFSDPALEFVTITGCEVSLDRSIIQVYVSTDSERYDEVVRACKRASGRLRSLLGHALGWRHSPELRFSIDVSADQAERIARALEQKPPTLHEEPSQNEHDISEEKAPAQLSPNTTQEI